jgi:hypothetical protein
MSDTALITETILDADGLDAEAFQRLYAEYVRTETIFGTVPMEADDADGTLTVTIHDPTTSASDETVRVRPNFDPMDLYGMPEYIADGSEDDA